MKKFSAIIFALVLSGCMSPEYTAREQVHNLCGSARIDQTAEEQEKLRQCMQNSYPQFLNTEINRRAAIDASIQNQQMINAMQQRNMQPSSMEQYLINQQQNRPTVTECTQLAGTVRCISH